MFRTPLHCAAVLVKVFLTISIRLDGIGIDQLRIS